MTRTTREFGISSVAALAIALAALPAGAQTVTPALPSAASDAVWAQYLSTSAPATGTTASTEDAGDRTWARYGIGAAAVGAGGLFSFYLANSHSSDPGPFVGGSAAPVAPESSGSGPGVSETGQASTQGGSSPTTSSAGTAAAPSASPAASGASSATPAPAASNGAASSTPAPIATSVTPSSTPAPVASQGTPSTSTSPVASGPRPSSSTPHPGTGAVTVPSTAGPVSAPAAHGASQATDAPPVIVSEAVSSPSADAAAPITVTPEPSTLVLLMSGVLAFLFLNRRRRIA